MKFNRAVRCRMYPNKEQTGKINITLGCCRYVYNHMLSRNDRIYKRRGEHLSYNDMQNLLPVMKDYQPWLKKADSQALNYACRQLDSAYKMFFKGLGEHPVFHKRKGRQSYTTTHKERIYIIDRHHVRIPVIGIVYVRGMKQLPEGAKTGYATVSREPDGKYYVSIAYEFEIPDPKHHSGNAIGLDYKVSCLYVDSDGDNPELPNWTAENQGRLAKEQRKLARKKGSKKGERKSKRWWKQMRKVAKIQSHTANQRKDFLHKESKRLADTYGTVCIEDLSVKEMNVNSSDVGTHRSEHSINKAILGTGWYMFTQMLEYKSAGRGGKTIKVGKNFRSTKTCSVCGYIETGLKDLKIREWKCPVCGTIHDRDVNAAVNILNEGLRLLKAV